MPGLNILETVRSTCQRVVGSPGTHVKIDEEAIQQLASQLDPLEVAVTARGVVQMPIKFDTPEAEISFLAIYHLLDFGSGYDPVLKAKYQRDAREMCQFGALGMHINVKRLDAAWMAAFDKTSCQNFFGVESYEDAAVPNLPGVTMSRPGQLAGLVTLLTQSVQEAGNALQEEGAANFGQAIIAVVDGLSKRKHPTPAAALVQELIDNIPGFQDTGLYEGAQVMFARKAQALVFSLYSKFHKTDPRFNFADINSLTGDSGALMAAVLRAKGVLRYSTDLAAIVDNGQELAQGAHEREIRAAAVVALDKMTAAMNDRVNPAQLSTYYLYLTEQGQALHGNAKPHLTPGTTAY